MRKVQMRGVAGAAVMLLAIAGAARAAPGDEERRKVWDDVGQAAKKGPVDVPLLDEAVLHVPAGEVFVPQPQADRLLNLFGNPGSNPEMPGLLLPRAPNANWYMPVRFHKSGYIKDDDAKTWNADEMLKSLRDGTEEQNRERVKAGQPAVDIVGWSESPRYDAATQRLSWSLTSRPVGAKAEDPVDVNYNTYALGRDGYFSMNMVTSLKELDALRPVAEKQLAALEFRPGKRYADFDSKSDQVAGYGLASLVVADTGASRPGFAAQAGALLARYYKLGALCAGLFVVVVAVMSIRRRRQAAPARPVFANTVAEPSVAHAVDLDVGDAGTTSPQSPLRP